MAWVTPTAFVANEILTAAKLNELVDAVAFLNGLSAKPIPPFAVVRSTNNTQVVVNYNVRHRSNYLHIVTDHNGANRFVVTVAGTVRTSSIPSSGARDTVLDMSAYGLTVGAFVLVTVDFRANAGATMSLLYITELASSGSLV